MAADRACDHVASQRPNRVGNTEDGIHRRVGPGCAAIHGIGKLGQKRIHRTGIGNGDKAQHHAHYDHAGEKHQDRHTEGHNDQTERNRQSPPTPLNAGDLFIVAGAICFALYTVLLRRANFVLERLPLLVVLLAAAAITASPFYVWEMLHDERTALKPAGLLGLAYLAVPGGDLMYYLFNWSVEKLGASKAGMLLYSQTVFIAVLAYIFPGERLYPYHVIGAAFILAGVLLVMLLKPQPLGSAAVPSRAEH